MASAIIHIAVANEVNKKLKRYIKTLEKNNKYCYNNMAIEFRGIAKR